MMPLFLPTASLIVDLFVSVSSMEKVRPQEYTIEGLNHNDGSSVIKIPVASNIVPLQPKSAQSYLMSFRLVWHLPHGQLHVMRVTADTTVSEALQRLLRERDLRHHTFLVFDTREPARSLNVREALGHYGIRDLTLEWADEAALGSGVSSNLATQSQPSQLVLFLLAWQLPDGQAHSTPVSADTTVSEALHRLFHHVDLDYGRYMVYNTREPNQPLHESLPLGHYGIRELTLIQRTSEAAAPPYPVLTVSSVSSRKSSQRSVDSVDSRHLSLVQTMSGSSAELPSVSRPLGQPSRPPRKRAKAPPPPAPPAFTAPKKRPAPQPPTSVNSVIRVDSGVKSNSSTFIITQPTHGTCESMANNNADHNSLKEVKPASASPSKQQILDSMKYEDDHQISYASVSSDLAREPVTKCFSKNNVYVSNEEQVLLQDTNATLNEILPSSVNGLYPESLNGSNVDKSEDHSSSLFDETQCEKTSKETSEEESGHRIINKNEKSEELHQSICSNEDSICNNLNVLMKAVPNTNNLYNKTNDNVEQLSSDIVGEGHDSAGIGNIVNGYPDKTNDTMVIDNNITEDSANVAKSSPPVVATSQIDSHRAAASLMCHHVETPLPDKISTKDVVSHNSVDETSFSSYRPSPIELLKQIELIKKDSKPKLVGAVRKVDLAHKEAKPLDMHIHENNNSDKTINTETKHNQVGSVTEALRRLHTQDMYIIPTSYSNTFERSYRAQPKPKTKTEAIRNDNNNMKIKDDILQPENNTKLSSLSLNRKHEVIKVTSASRHYHFLNSDSMSHPDGVVDEHRKGNSVAVNGTNKNNNADKLIGNKTKAITPPRFVLNSWKDLPKGPSVLKIADDSTHGSSADVDFQLQCLKFEDMHSPVPSPPLQGLTSIIATQTSDGLHAPSANI